MQYRKGFRDPVDGAYSVPLWRHSHWANNKGIFDLEDAGVRVFAFREEPIPGTPYRAVPEESSTEITKTAQVEVMQGIHPDNFPAVQIRVHGGGKIGVGGLNRVLAVQMYRTPEMDCFSDKALPYSKGLVDRHANVGHRQDACCSGPASLGCAGGIAFHGSSHCTPCAFPIPPIY
jgi:hypothetical protein